MPTRYDKESEYHFTTFNSYNRENILTLPIIPELLIEHLETIRRDFDVKIHGFVIMPNHVHILWWVDSELGVTKAVKQFKGSTGRHILRVISQIRGFDLQRVTKPDGRRALWLRGFYDFNVISERKAREKLEYIHANPVKWGLVAEPGDWPYSSFRSWFELPGSLFKVDRF